MTDLEPYEPNVDIEAMMTEAALEVLIRGTDEKFVELADELDVEEMSDAVAVLNHLSQSSSLRAGYLLYRIRQAVPDGEWGQKIWEFANEYQVSQRTIHRWMSAAQEYFGFELTPAQRNARTAVRPQPESGASIIEGPFDDLDDDEEDLFADLDSRIDEHALLNHLNNEAGWGDEAAPKPQRGTPDSEVPAGARAPLVAPDPTWVAFTAQSLQQEHPTYGDVAATRSATARWSRQLDEDPLGLLEDLEMIYESAGADLPDEIAAALYHAEEHKPIKPDAVTEGKTRKARKPALADSKAQKILESLRELHQQVHTGLKEGLVTDKEAAGMLTSLQLIPHTVAGLVQMAKDAKGRLGNEEKPMAEKIADTQAAPVAATVDDPGF